MIRRLQLATSALLALALLGLSYVAPSKARDPGATMLALAVTAAVTAATPSQPETDDEVLAKAIGEFYADPLGYIMFAFPWSSDPSIQICKLKGKWKKRFPNSVYGPDVWQCEYLDTLGKEIEERGFNPDKPSNVLPVQMAVASGHGIGKSALTAWLTCFLLDTRPNCRGTITANTGHQLEAKTFHAIDRWRKLSITSHWWDVSVGAMYVRHVNHNHPDPAQVNHARVDAITWKKERSEAFAGQHEASSSSWYIFDEGSAVHNRIWDVALGGLTDGEPFFFAFGNPTRCKGRLYDCFHRRKHRWITQQIDARKCALPNHKLHAQWIADEGEDSDFVRVRVRGVFPRGGSNQLISHETVRTAQLRKLPKRNRQPIIMGVDVARFGSNESVIAIRRGDDARSLKWKYYREQDGMQLAAQICACFDELDIQGATPSAIFIDGGGVGGPICDRVLQLGYPAIEVNFGGECEEPDRYRFKGTEMWGRMGEWMKTRGCIEDEPILADQTTDREYKFTDAQQKQLVSKKLRTSKDDDGTPDEDEEMYDRPDALALTFAYPVGKPAGGPRSRLRARRVQHQDFDPVEEAA